MPHGTAAEMAGVGRGVAAEVQAIFFAWELGDARERDRGERKRERESEGSGSVS